MSSSHTMMPSSTRTLPHFVLGKNCMRSGGSMMISSTKRVFVVARVRNISNFFNKIIIWRYFAWKLLWKNIWRGGLNNLKCIFYENWLGSICHMKRIDLEISRASTGHDVEIDSLDSIIFRRFWINMPYVWLFLNWVAQILVKSCWDDPIRVIVPWRFHWFSEHKYIKL